MEAGRNAGGQVGAQGHLPERSAAIRVVATPTIPTSTSGSTCTTAVVELRRVLEEFKRYEVFYRERGRDPSTAMTRTNSWPPWSAAPEATFPSRLNPPHGEWQSIPAG